MASPPHHDIQTPASRARKRRSRLCPSASPSSSMSFLSVEIKRKEGGRGVRRSIKQSGTACSGSTRERNSIRTTLPPSFDQRRRRVDLRGSSRRRPRLQRSVRTARLPTPQPSLAHRTRRSSVCRSSVVTYSVGCPPLTFAHRRFYSPTDLLNTSAFRFRRVDGLVLICVIVYCT